MVAACVVNSPARSGYAAAMAAGLDRGQMPVILRSAGIGLPTPNQTTQSPALAGVVGQPNHQNSAPRGWWPRAIVSMKANTSSASR